MGSKYVPLDKQSKRKQREFHAAHRGNWGSINPVTRKPANPKAYNRKKSGQWFKEPPPGFFALSVLFHCTKLRTQPKIFGHRAFSSGTIGGVCGNNKNMRTTNTTMYSAIIHITTFRSALDTGLCLPSTLRKAA